MPSSWSKTSIGISRRAWRRSPPRMQAARELGTPIIAMTVVLLAVYVPIGFQGGLTGALFTEFVFTLAGAVTVSAIIALTLSPMMCSKLLKPHRDGPQRLGDPPGRVHRRALRAPAPLVSQRKLERSLHYTPVTAVFVVLVLVSIGLLYRSAKSELAPQEDQGFVLRAADLGARCDPAAKAAVRRPGPTSILRAQDRRRTHLPDRRARPVLHRLILGRSATAARARPRSSSLQTAARLDRRPEDRRPSSSRRCPGRIRACRCSSSSRPPSRALRLNDVSRGFLARRRRAACSCSSTPT